MCVKFFICLHGDFSAASLRCSQIEAQSYTAKLKLNCSLSESNRSTNLVVVIGYVLRLKKSCSPVCSNHSLFDGWAWLVSPIVNGKQSIPNHVFQANVKCLPPVIHKFCLCKIPYNVG